MKATFLTAVVILWGLPAVSTIADAVTIPVHSHDEAVASQFTQYLTTGAPGDSIQLRVSILAGCGRGLWTSVRIEELAYPPPSYGVIVGVKEDSVDLSTRLDGPWLKAAVEIAGSFFQARGDSVDSLWSSSANTGTGIRIRAGRLRTRDYLPLEFVGWLSPVEFAIKSRTVCYVIRRVEAARYELVSISRVP